MRRRPISPVVVLTAIAAMTVLGVTLHAPLAALIKRAGTRRRSGALRFSFVIHRPVPQVFAFCADFENFPKFIGALRKVTDTGDGRSHWRARTPSGRTIEWDAITTKFLTNSVIAWKSVLNSPVITQGVLRFSPEGEDTCVNVSIDYAVAHSHLVDALAALLRRRRIHDLEDDIRAMEDTALTAVPVSAPTM